MRLEDLREAVTYFTKWDMNLLMDAHRQEADKAVQALNPDALLSTPIDDVVASIVSKYEFDIPVLLREEAHMEEPRETSIAKND